MITVIIVAIFAGAIMHFAGRLYLLRKKHYTEISGPVWADLRDEVEALIADDTAPEKVVSFAYAVAMQTGCGFVTNRILMDLIMGRFLRKVEKAKDSSFARMISELTPEQSHRLGRILVNAVEFDSLQLPLRGVILRRVLWWMRPPSEQRDEGLAEDQLERVAISARHALRGGESHHRELAVAC